MTRTELDLIKRALDLLRRVLPDDGEPHAVDAPRRCSVMAFAKRFLIRDPGSDMTSIELWSFFGEVAAAGELEPLSKSDFLRRLPAVMEAMFSAKKCHSIQRDGRRVRGFKGITVSECATPVTLELEPG